MDLKSYRLTRRGVLQQGSAAAALGLVGRWPLMNILNRPTTLARAKQSATERSIDCMLIDPSLIQRLAMRAIDVAKSAGATYADVRISRTLKQEAGGAHGLLFTDSEELGVGVRALVNGAWGFAATSYWTDDEVVRVAQAATAQAKSNAVGVLKPIEFAPMPAVTGHWVMPIKEDPFLIPWETKLNIIQGTTTTANQQLPLRSRVGGSLNIGLMAISCYRQERALATTDGTYVTQTVYRTGGDLKLDVSTDDDRPGAIATASGVETTGRGWEIFAAARLIDQVPRMLDEAEFEAALPVKPVDVGQYDIVCDAFTMAAFIDNTFGHATELDRVLGLEANASGTSYLGPDPTNWLGQSVASPLVHITANRSLEGGVATVKWDDDGVTSTDFPIVTAGKLVDYQTTREHAQELSAWYAQQHQPVQSHGCAMSQDARTIPLSMVPNLALTPAATGPTLDALIGGIKKGFAILQGSASTDFQAKNGMLQGSVYEIKDGKKVARISKAGVLFSATEFWKNLTALGGPSTVAPLAQPEYKGQPGQETWHTVSGAAATFKNVSVVDVTRKA